MPRLDLGAVHAHPVEQQLQVVLRVGQRVGAPDRRSAGLSGLAGETQIVPHLVIEREVEIGQDHRAVFELADRTQQLRQRGRGAGDPRSNNGLGWRVFPPAPGGMLEQAIAPGGRIDLAALVEQGEPVRLDRRKQTGRILPVVGELGKKGEHALLEQLSGRDSLDQQAIHRACDFARLPQPRCGEQPVVLGVIRVMILEQPRQFEPAARRIDRGRDRGRLLGFRGAPLRYADRPER